MEIAKRDRDPIVDLVRNVINTHFEDLPEEIVTFEKKRVLDNIGTLFAGSHAAGVETLIDFVKESSGKKESTILAHGGQVTCQDAAFVNSVMARAIDYCDVVDPGYRPSSTDIPTAFAVGEMMGSSGKDVITALAAGGDLALRINAGGAYPISEQNPYYGFDSNVVAVFGSAAIAGKLLDLNEEQMVHAMGIAFNQACGSFQSNIDGSIAVKVIQGSATRSGIVSAILAKKGITGAKNVLFGPFGWFQLYTRGKCNQEILMSQLGDKYYGPEYLIFKKYPCCTGNIPMVAAILDLVLEYDIRPEDVEGIGVRLDNMMYTLLGKPFAPGENPEVDAVFSARYNGANALLRRSSKLIHYTKPLILEPGVLSLTNKINLVPDKNFHLLETMVNIRLKNGKEYSLHTQNTKGWPQNPLSKDELEAKFRDCMNFTSTKLGIEKVETIIEIVNHLETLKDLSDLIKILVHN